MHAFLRLPLALLVPVLLLSACVDVDEELAIDAKGGGTYELTIVWDQALLDRLTDVVGATAASRLRGRDLPLDVEAWRDSLRGVAGLQVRHTQVLDQGDGRRLLRVKVAFDRLEDLLGWDVFVRRSIAVQRPEANRAELSMDPLARVPFLDPVAEALGRIEDEAEGSEPGLGVLDPSPRERLGLSSRAAGEARALLEPALENVTLVFRVRTPGPVTEVGPDGAVEGAERKEARFALDFARLRKDWSRSLRLSWRPRAGDAVPVFQHEGDRSPASAGEGALR